MEVGGIGIESGPESCLYRHPPLGRVAVTPWAGDRDEPDLYITTDVECSPNPS